MRCFTAVFKEITTGPSSARRIESGNSQPIPLTSTLILFTRLRLDHESGPSLQVFQIQMAHDPCFSLTSDPS